MPVIVVANPKGGVGKSTLATQIAGFLAARGRAVTLGDLDRQQSSRQWLAVRPPQAPRIALVLSDVVMPELSGWSLAEALRASHPGLPVIFMSGYGEDEMWERRVRAPQAPVLRKPLSRAELLEAVRGVLAA